MIATFKISEDDYVNAMLLFSKPTPRLIFVYIAFILAIIAIAVSSTSSTQAGAMGGLIGGITVVLLMRYVGTPFMARRHYRKYKAIQDEFTIELIDEGIRFASADADGKLRWDKILKWRENKDYVLVYPMPRLYHIIPKSISSNGFDIEGLTNDLLQHVGTPE